MALPTLSSRWGQYGVDKRWQALHEQQNNNLNHWKDVVKYHSDTALRSSWDAQRPSSRSQHKNLDDRSSRNRKSANLHKRRMKLANLLKDERDVFEDELKELNAGRSSRLDEMKDRAEELKSAREEKDRKIAQEKLYDHWKINNPDLRALDSELHQNHVTEAWQIQKHQKTERQMEEREDERQFANEYEEARVRAMEALQKKEEQRRRAEVERGKILKQQMKELQERVEESDSLRQEEAKILQDQLKLEKTEEERKKMRKQVEQRELGFFLHRQYRAQMRKRAREIQEELELDRQILERILEEEQQEQEMKSARQEKAKKDVEWMKQIMEEQMKLEKERESELDLMYREEARQVWEKREEVWKKEREARERLLRDVLDERSDQLSQKMLENQRKQKLLLKERNDLIIELEAAKAMSQREQKEREQLELRQRDELEEQVTTRREKTARQRDAEIEELKAEEEAERGYRQFLNDETQRRKRMGYQPKQFGRRRTAWD